MNNKLKEHKKFRNQLFIANIVLLGLGFGFNQPDLIGFGFIFVILTIWNFISYSKNKKKFKLNEKRNNY